MKTFNVRQCDSIEELTNGVAMSQALYQIAPEFFNHAWLSKIKPDATNWGLRANNLRKVYQGIKDYFEMNDDDMNSTGDIDVNSLAKECNVESLIGFLQLILYCAVNCDQKEEYVGRIMKLEENVQHDVMKALQDLNAKAEAAKPQDADSNDKIKKEIEYLKSRLAEYETKCRKLDTQVTELQEDKRSLEDELSSVKDRFNKTPNWEDPSSPANMKIRTLQNQVEKLEEDAFKFEMQRDEFKTKSETLEKQLSEKVEKLNILTDETLRMKDELDILRNNQHKMAKYEASIESYKNKLKELSDLKNQNKELEEKNADYMENSLELENELRKAQSYKNQLEGYKTQVHDIQTKIIDETKRADKAEFELKRVSERINLVSNERDRLKSERDSLKETIEELNCAQVQQTVLSQNPPPDNLSHISQISNSDSFCHDSGNQDSIMDPNSDLPLVGLPLAIKERLRRLEQENKMLKVSVKEGEEKELIASQLEDANKRVNELENDVRTANKTICELQCEVNDMKYAQERETTHSDKDFSVLKNELKSERTKNKDLNEKITELQSKIEERESEVTAKPEEVQSLKDVVQDQQAQIQSMESRYQMYLEKCRNYIIQIDGKNRPQNNEVALLKKQLEEKNKLIEFIEKGNEKNREVREFEEKAVASAWYNLSLQLHKETATERLSNAVIGQSFLARQRNTCTRKSLQSLQNPR
ncbi:DgyrCDS1734 [Dimorphilus gyrociliatus]|uniref:DgyrCDS1734 n=1 Tax=Dimorphilus gyrociliatus TaxID=2664684 RepID=A0A7I8VBE4_9ANNE|nr:DgyrCDS1734 [Dimorphilus gyrociliatus]